MMQFYFLSVLLNLASGFLLVSKKNNVTSEKEVAVLNDSSKTKSRMFFESKLFSVIAGVLSIFVGVFKLFVVAGKTKILILGDFFPAAAGVLGGFALLVAYFVEKSTTSENLNVTFKKIFVTNSSLVGIACIIIAILHFLFPGALFL